MTLGCETKTAPPPTAARQPAAEETPRTTAASLADNTPPGAPNEFIPPKLTADELAAGWISLFDGDSLFGWDVPEGTNWRVEDQCIVADDGERSLLTTPFEFADFEFRCDFHLSEGGNSGVFLRTSREGNNPETQSYELNICDSHDSFPTGSFVARHKAENVPAVEGAWHTFFVRFEGKQVVVQLDGKQIVDFTDETENARSRGVIGLQMNSGRIAFRNVHLKPLGGRDLFNGKDLSGLRLVPGAVTKFTVEEGLLHAEDGPGFLETEDAFGDFILQVDANINDEKAIADKRPANSGIFFRAQPGTEKAPSHGYEMQIQHNFDDGDRGKPSDFGAGGIYRRQPARYVVGNNNEWVTQTLIAEGPRFATFVNGYQVLYWEDTRKPDENPRKGLRLEPGHISIQGHDPTTMLDIRKLTITE